MPEHPDLIRLRNEYARRAGQASRRGRYSLFNPAQLFAVQQRQRALLKCLLQNGLYPLSKQRIFELGPGVGGILLEILSFGADASRLHGAELLFSRAQKAHERLASLPLICADGQSLPYAAESFDLSMQFTVLSSILDDELRANVAREMIRVTRPGGLIVCYDFWLNPANSQTHGLRPAEIRQLFPGCAIKFDRITLAPPIARRIVPFSWGLALFLEGFKIFNTHYLASIRPESAVRRDG